MIKEKIGELIKFSYPRAIGEIDDLELYGAIDDFGKWVSTVDICRLLHMGKNARKKMLNKIDESNKCIKVVIRDPENSNTTNSEIFVRDECVYDIIYNNRKDIRYNESFIYEVLSEMSSSGEIDVERKLTSQEQVAMKALKVDLKTNEDSIDTFKWWINSCVNSNVSGILGDSRQWIEDQETGEYFRYEFDNPNTTRAYDELTELVDMLDEVNETIYNYINALDDGDNYDPDLDNLHEYVPDWCRDDLDEKVEEKVNSINEHTQRINSGERKSIKVSRVSFDEMIKDVFSE